MVLTEGTGDAEGVIWDSVEFGSKYTLSASMVISPTV